MRKTLSLLTPILLHQAIALAVAFLFGVCRNQYGIETDAAFAVLIGNLLVIPFAARMYRKDMRQTAPSEASERPQAGDCQTEAPASRTERRKRQIMFGVCCFAAGGVLNVIWSGVLYLARIQAHFSNQTQEQLFAANLIVQVIGLGIVAPIAEELIFRGLTYRRMRQMFPLWAAVFLSALLFAVYHGNSIQMIFAFPLAIVLALIYERGKLLIFPVLFHMGSNLTAIFLQILLH